MRWQGDVGDPDAPVRSELHFFVGGGAWAVLEPSRCRSGSSLRSWRGPSSAGALSHPCARTSPSSGRTPRGVSVPGAGCRGPRDPFSALVALVGSLSPGDPSRRSSCCGCWRCPSPFWRLVRRHARQPSRRRCASSRRSPGRSPPPSSPPSSRDAPPGSSSTCSCRGCSSRRAWRIVLGAGRRGIRPARRVLACAPSLGPATVVLWCAALVVVALVAGRGVARVVWLLVPSMVIFARWCGRRCAPATRGPPGDPGVPYAGAEVSADPIGRALLAAGVPNLGSGGWVSLLGHPVWWWACSSHLSPSSPSCRF